MLGVPRAAGAAERVCLLQRTFGAVVAVESTAATTQLPVRAMPLHGTVPRDDDVSRAEGLERRLASLGRTVWLGVIVVRVVLAVSVLQTAPAADEWTQSVAPAYDAVFRPDDDNAAARTAPASYVFATLYACVYWALGALRLDTAWLVYVAPRAVAGGIAAGVDYTLFELARLHLHPTGYVSKLALLLSLSSWSLAAYGCRTLPAAALSLIVLLALRWRRTSVALLGLGCAAHAICGWRGTLLLVPVIAHHAALWRRKHGILVVAFGLITAVVAVAASVRTAQELAARVVFGAELDAAALALLPVPTELLLCLKRVFTPGVVATTFAHALAVLGPTAALLAACWKVLLRPLQPAAATVAAMRKNLPHGASTTEDADDALDDANEEQRLLAEATRNAIDVASLQRAAMDAIQREPTCFGPADDQRVHNDAGADVGDDGRMSASALAKKRDVALDDDDVPVVPRSVRLKLTARGMARHTELLRLVGATMLMAVVVHATSGAAEAGATHALVPIAALAVLPAAGGWLHAGGMLWEHRRAVTVLLMLAHAALFVPAAFIEQRGVIDAMTFLRDNPMPPTAVRDSHEGSGFEYEVHVFGACAATPGYTMLHGVVSAVVQMGCATPTPSRTADVTASEAALFLDYPLEFVQWAYTGDDPPAAHKVAASRETAKYSGVTAAMRPPLALFTDAGSDRDVSPRAVEKYWLFTRTPMRSGVPRSALPAALRAATTRGSRHMPHALVVFAVHRRRIEPFLVRHGFHRDVALFNTLLPSTDDDTHIEVWSR